VTFCRLSVGADNAVPYDRYGVEVMERRAMLGVGCKDKLEAYTADWD
jgi:hypothetical protein